ncbi:hypothetical protein VOLCADRAFT_89485 [Volvox carteri f. nagariensis]|uniref:WW domain-containing protein n=1 Tax=Volvox carteri f. nagariensis TaxID=3068 RepID=D8TRY8_VOLCA|nr:uncharacterized protein VOLCADRAFT_89485 [Volvox carteri f. nagariensis]EFJ49601.1 hypothetical protein VOLCADRAFT_89485 [Volvox carteri f. nagariensis]|eukprot:XP_002949108.1 hypothetical protein VOLCADRAFT_89485 [Volvox carteri f. nagariensis]
MALRLAGRRLPSLRYLSALATNRSDYAFGSLLCSNSISSNAGGADNTSSVNTKEELGKSSSGSHTQEAPVSAVPSAPTGAGTSPASTSQPTPVEEDEEWTEVVHSSGQLYYWNQRTGETTRLGEPKPNSDRGSGGAGGGGGRQRASGGSGARTEDGYVDPRSEAHLEDRTGTYAAMGVIIGAFLGWVSQFV